ncbi:conserved hypothetical protein (plasmid) [Sulfolobus islandicus Y.N.15.51]|uniref:Uncharacterized protein n=1 Tax=Saccharolobus islandicus (strain Y.N.15.51 / Yellowstone \|nr:hypothetical protein [Sulfolobus islandicus]ACP50099.1 conserved hypothetical protein [Sulfolobus islandicus Y.N.15.51]
MGDNIFGMDIRRFSVLFIAIIIILAFIASFANLKVPQQNSSIQIGSGGGSSGSYSVPGPKYIYNKTVTLSPSLQDLQYVRGSYSNLPAPYYNISPEAYILFNFSKPDNNMLNLLFDALARNASEIAPGPYGALLSIASSAYVNITNYKNTSLQPFPLNENDTENYSKWDIIVKYGKTLEAPNGFQSGWSYPPSDLISVNPPVYKIINETSVKTSVNVQYNEYTYLYNKYTHNQGNVTYVYEYYAMKVWGTAYLYANNQLINSQSFATTFYWYGGEYGPNYIYGTITVPPESTQEVYGSYSISAGAGYKHYQRTVNNTTYIYYIYYPTGPYLSTTSYNFNWYEYNVTLPIMVIVYNGSDPQTLINNKIYNSRNITAYFTYTTWSSDPIANSTTIVTYDHIQIANYTIERIWHAGNIEIIPLLNTQQDWNTINYYLTFNVQDNTVQPPYWISQKMIYSKSAAISWFYLEQNATLAHTLYNYIMKTINKTDFQYWKFEYFVLASQFVMYTFNTTSSVFTNLLELESFYENWSLVTANILNLSAWPKLQYFNYQIMFFNISRIPQIYNNTIFMNITGNYEIYLVDIYNALYYSGFNKVPFGNIYYYFNPLNNETTYFYLNTTGQHIPYLHETLCFTSANYIPNIFYATFQYTAAVKTEIIAIWNGTVWVS